MKEKKSDRRVIYTKMIIKQALLDLMKDHPINKITVTHICELAEINRGTFYAHYTDPYDLMIQIENELFSELKNFLEKSIEIITNTDLITKIMEYIAENIALCKIIISENGDKEFMRRVVNIAHDQSISEDHLRNPDLSADELEQRYIFISNGIFGIIENWIVNDTKQSPKEIAEFIAKMMNKIM
ncbi:TetR family transcriptional regulator C-terminal domain-containing protein [Dehalobacter sp. DCM]|uniref:TetR/AcrR family transcriptional regulator n=1 Tax=Dehalobacter sp. DCM TaxID=2907827 RepID=UPI003081C0D7|nr:TetR family transcriptional regulator C-terminal domain-containing protein [Dehalobacter sp. DCM]